MSDFLDQIRRVEEERREAAARREARLAQPFTVKTSYWTFELTAADAQGKRTMRCPERDEVTEGRLVWLGRVGGEMRFDGSDGESRLSGTIRSIEPDPDAAE
ncbi:hypothetical protein EPO33_02515 [Patescibacteria group bacterium]|nr:MAG: hypothetical protein EPO33_02515 [Patescibacteria group bacterium]